MRQTKKYIEDINALKKHATNVNHFFNIDQTKINAKEQNMYKYKSALAIFPIKTNKNVCNERSEKCY